jgi:cytoskeletal protein RodZ
VEFLGSSAQAEQLKVIGSRLSEERQNRSVSLQQVAAKTYIPLRLLNAIEAGRLDLLPEPVFIQGFIRRYADMLGLDGMSISKEFPVNPSPVPITPETIKTTLPPVPIETDTAKVDPIKADTTEANNTVDNTARINTTGADPARVNVTPPPADPLPVPALKVERPVSSESSFDSDNKSEGASKLPWIVGGVLGLGAIALLASLLNRPAPPKPAQNPAVPATSASKAPATSPASAPATTEASSAPSPVASPTISPEATGPVAVELSFTDDSWVEIQADGEVVFEGTLLKGTKRLWSGKDQVVVSAGNAGAVSASYNKSAAKTLGALGDVTTTTFPPIAGQ